MLRGSSLIAGRLQTLFRVGTLGPLNDRQLLELFNVRKDEAAESAFAVRITRAHNAAGISMINPVHVAAVRAEIPASRKRPHT